MNKILRFTSKTLENFKVLNFRSFSKYVETGITTIQDAEDFKRRVIENDNLVIVDFFATWCNPCKLLTPRLETIMEKYKDKILLAKVDVDSDEFFANTYKITSVPTIVAIKKGKEIDRLMGLKESEALKKFIDDSI